MRGLSSRGQEYSLSAIPISFLLSMRKQVLLESLGHAKPLPAVLANIGPFPSVRALVVLQQGQSLAGLSAVRAGVAVQAKVDLLVDGQLGGPAKGFATDGTLERLLLRVGPLVGHELGGAGEVAVTDVAGEKGVPQHALLILGRMTLLEVALLALVVAENDVTLQALQGELGSWWERDTERNKVDLY